MQVSALSASEARSFCTGFSAQQWQKEFTCCLFTCPATCHPDDPVQIPSIQAYDPNPVYPSTCKETQGTAVHKGWVSMLLI